MEEERLQSSKASASAAALGEAPPLQERGVVGLRLVGSRSFLTETTSHREEDLERGRRRPHLKGVRSGGEAWDCLRRSSSSATTMSSLIAARIHSSFIIIIIIYRKAERER